MECNFHWNFRIYIWAPVINYLTKSIPFLALKFSLTKREEKEVKNSKMQTKFIGILHTRKNHKQFEWSDGKKNKANDDEEERTANDFQKKSTIGAERSI